MPNDWQRSLVTLTAVVVTAIGVAALYLARSVFVPIALAVFLTFVLSPVVARVQRWGLGRLPAVVLTVGLLVVVTAGVGTLVVHQVSGLADTLPDRKEAIKAKIAAAKTAIVGDGNSRLAEMADDIGRVLAPQRSADPDRVVVERSSLAAEINTYATPAVEFLGQFALAFILTVFFLIKKEDLRNRMIRLLGDGRVTTTTRALDDASQRVSRFLMVQLMVNAGFGVAVTLGLLVLGVDYAVLWGLIGTVMRYVPYIGTPLGLIPPVLFSFATAPDWGGGWGQPVAVLALFVGLEVICNNVFEPWLYGRSMGVSEVALLVAAGFLALLWGPIGLVLSGPIMTCLVVLGRHAPGLKFLHVLIGDEPALAPHLAFYQRLAARDQDEAADVALAAAQGGGLEGALEGVVVPALAMARRDLDRGDLDPADFRFAVAAAREVVAEVADLRPEPEALSDDRVRVLVVPTRDEAEHVAAEALAATLDPARWETRIAGDEMLASELVSAVGQFGPAVVVLAALPPGGVAHCRYLVNRLRTRCPGVRVLVGRWDGGAGDGFEPDEPPTAVKGADGVGRTLGETRKQLTDMLPVLAAQVRRDAREAVGTPTA